MKERLGLTSTDWRRTDKATVDAPLQALIQKWLNSANSAMAVVYVPLGYDHIKGIACSYLLSQIVESWFYKQLSTQEQLGYAVFMLPILSAIWQASGLYCKAVAISRSIFTSAIWRFSLRLASG